MAAKTSKDSFSAHVRDARQNMVWAEQALERAAKRASDDSVADGLRRLASGQRSARGLLGDV